MPEAPRPLPPPTVQPLAPALYRVQFTASARLRDKLERLRALMRPEVPDGDLGAIIERAVTEKLERLEGRRFARTRRPRKGLEETDTSPSATPGGDRPAKAPTERGFPDSTRFERARGQLCARESAWFVTQDRRIESWSDG